MDKMRRKERTPSGATSVFMCRQLSGKAEAELLSCYGDATAGRGITRLLAFLLLPHTVLYGDRLNDI
jgi:hypothetical protein